MYVQAWKKPKGGKMPMIWVLAQCGRRGMLLQTQLEPLRLRRCGLGRAMRRGSCGRRDRRRSYLTWWRLCEKSRRALRIEKKRKINYESRVE